MCDLYTKLTSFVNTRGYPTSVGNIRRIYEVHRPCVFTIGVKFRVLWETIQACVSVESWSKDGALRVEGVSQVSAQTDAKQRCYRLCTEVGLV